VNEKDVFVGAVRTLTDLPQ